MQYRREIDGLRAVAVLPVILFHAKVPFFDGGYVGVDVFFVISGFLITSIILGELEAGRFSLAVFYERRARRILPGLLLVIAVSVPVGWLVLPPGELTVFSRSIAAVALFSSNFFFWQDGAYFATAAEVKPLLHTWSLAVEEQYYLLFPLIVMATWRFGRRRLGWLLALGAGVSLLASQIASVRFPNANFFFSPTRAWELAIGAGLALPRPDSASNALSRPVREMLAAVGLSLILLAVLMFDSDTKLPSVLGLVPTCGAALVIVCARPDTIIGRYLATRLMVGIGMISYGAYLWHQPVFAFVRY